MAASNDVEDSVKLRGIFEKLWTIYEQTENSSEPCSSQAVQDAIQLGIQQAEKAVHMVNELNMFSDNEQIDEISSKDLRFMLLPALLGYFTNKNMKTDRFDVVQKSQVYFVDFIRLCKLYGLTDCELPKLYVKTSDSDEQQVPSKTVPTKSSTQSLEDQMRKRERKIELYKRRKQQEQTLHELTEYIKQEHADEEQVRKYYLTLVNKWLLDTFDNLESIEAELPMLEHMARMKAKGQTTTEKPPSAEKAAPMRPFIITKDALQKAVFGLGYPSMPTFTVDEFYDQRVKEGLFPSAEHGHSHGASNANRSRTSEKENDELKAAEEDKKRDNDDPETLQKQRDWDDWKDDHRCGWGNTHNKG